MGDLSVQVRSALEAFASEHQQQGKRLRDLLAVSPQAFVEVVRGILLEGRDTPETRYVLALLSARGMLLGVLRDVARIDRGAAGVVAHMAQKMDPGFERSLARSVLDEQAKIDGDPEFLLGMVESLTGGLALLPLLGKLRTSPNVRVRAKLARMLGKAARAQEWFNELRTDPDARVRANAMEALWTSESSYTAACYESALEDGHHRVVANALVGMHLQGDSRCVKRLVELARGADGMGRAAAAWAMGRTGDPRFVPLLRELRKDGSNVPMVVRHALQSITKIRQAQASTMRRELRLRVMESAVVECAEGRKWEEAVLLARDAESGRPVEVRDTAWAPEVDGRQAWEYEVRRPAPPARLGCAFLLPARRAETERGRHWQRLLEEFFLLRRRSDVGAVQFYSEEAHPRYGGRTGDILRIAEEDHGGKAEYWEAGLLLQDQARLAEVLKHVPEARHLAEGPAGPLESLAEGLSTVNGGRHVVLVADEMRKAVYEAEAWERAGEALRAHEVRLHVLASRQAPVEVRTALDRLSQTTGGLSLSAQTLEEAVSDARDLLTSLYGGYRLRFPVSGAGRRRVEVHESDYEGHAEWHWREEVSAA